MGPLILITHAYAFAQIRNWYADLAICATIVKYSMALPNNTNLELDARLMTPLRHCSHVLKLSAYGRDSESVNEDFDLFW